MQQHMKGCRSLFEKPRNVEQVRAAQFRMYHGKEGTADFEKTLLIADQ